MKEVVEVMVVSERRMAALEARTRRLEARVAQLDGLEAARSIAPPRPAAPRPSSAAAAPAAARPSSTAAAPAAARPSSTAAAPAAARPSSAAAAPPPTRCGGPAGTAAPAPHGGPAGTAAPAPHGGPAGTAPWEDLVGGRVLGWIGGLAVLVGILFFLVIAASRGWIGEAARVLMAGGGSLLLLAAGAWLHERRVRNEAALAAAAAGIAGLFATAVVAGPVYDLLPALAALVFALAIGAAATVLALRFRAPGIGWLGILGALASPALVGAAATGEGIALMLVAYAAAGAVLLWQRWHFLAGAAFLVAVPQLAWWLATGWSGSTATAVAALALFGVVTAAAAAGFEWRAGTAQVRVSAHVLLALGALALTGLGGFAFDDDGVEYWLAALALAHVAAGLVLRASPRVSRELSLSAFALGVMLADVAFATVADGLPLVAGWAAGAVAFAALTRTAVHRSDGAVALAGLGGHLLLAIATALSGTVPFSAVNGDSAETAIPALAAIAAGAWVAARLLEARFERLRPPLDATALIALAALSAVALDGPALTLALTAEGAALAAIARRARRAGAAGDDTPAMDRREMAGGDGPTAERHRSAAIDRREMAGGDGPTAERHGSAAIDRREMAGGDGPTAERHRSAAIDRREMAGGDGPTAERHRSAGDPVPLAGALAFLGAALAHGLVVLAPPAALMTGLDDPLGAAIGLAAIAGGAVLTSLATTDRQLRVLLHAGAAVLALYLASTLLVTPFEPHAEQGQALLSALWALAGVATLVAGLLRDSRELRLGALALLTITIGKVFTVDLASLTALNRVASCIALGLLLLLGAFAWQRIRPRDLPDLRDVPGAFR